MTLDALIEPAEPKAKLVWVQDMMHLAGHPQKDMLAACGQPIDVG